jgi:IMP dehydrogenase
MILYIRRWKLLWLILSSFPFYPNAGGGGRSEEINLNAKRRILRMAFYYEEPCHTFNEYLLVPGYSSAECTPDNVSLKTPITKFKKGEEPAITMNIPMTSAIMQSVSNDTLAVALAKEGGISFIYGSQTIEQETAMIAKVKAYKAGFVTSDSNIKPDQTLADILELKQQTGHSTVAVTNDGTGTGKLLGVVSSRDYRVSRMSVDTKVSTFMTPIEKVIYAKKGATLSECNDIIWANKLNSLPVVDKDGCLCYFVFRKDYSEHKENVGELLDPQKRYVVGAGINTRDYETRVPALLAAGADILCIDSSEGYSEWQKRTIAWIRGKYGDKVKVGAGNVIDGDGFRFLAECGADFVKIGIGGGSICITRETKGIGRGQATAVIEVAKERDKYYKETGIYVPICSDGGIVYDHHVTLALAMGADFVMLGRYFSRFDESPTNKVNINGQYMKEYWGEGSNRARNWQRYDLGGAKKLSFEEGVDSYVPYAGSLHDNVQTTLNKVRSTMCNCGALTIAELQQKAKLTLVSSTSIVEGGAHDVLLKDSNNQVK